ncbi:MAG TPA: thioredoxin domain-containing protein [Burkholderiales bacterium]
MQRSAPRAVAPLAPPIVAVDPQRALGSADARVAIVEFADYQCPYCRSFHLNALPRLKERYIDTGRVRFYYMDFPLAQHAHALDASIAAHCAGRQSRYWDMQQRLYAEQARLGDALYARLAAELALDAARFAACRSSNEARAAVERDLLEGRRLGVRGTPTFIVGRIVEGGVALERMAFGVPTFETFAEELELLLE